jgi:hypothetical protein
MSAGQGHHSPAKSQNYDPAVKKCCLEMVIFVLFRILQKLRSLVAMNENLKKQEQQFKAHCKVIILFQLLPYIHDSC